MTGTPQRDQPHLRRLERGEVVTESTLLEDGLREATASVIYQAEPERVWRVLCDLEHYVDFMPYTRVGEVVREEGEEVWFRTEIRIVVHRIAYTLRMRRDHERLRLSWTKVEGNLKTNDGFWQLEAHGEDQTLAFYSIRLDPGLPAPQALLEYLAHRSLPEVIEAVRDRLRDCNNTRRLQRPTFVEG